MANNEHTKNLELLYQENAKVATIFWEWRFKLMTAFFAGNSALFALTGWFYQHGELRRWLFGPLLLGATLSGVSFFLDRRNAEILKHCYRVGEKIEMKLLEKEVSELLEGKVDKGLHRGGIFQSINQAHQKGITYTLVLGLVYGLTTVVLLFFSGWAAGHFFL